MYLCIILSVVLSVCRAIKLDFPPKFKFGCATSSYQIEGAWNISDKAESIWDRHTHTFPEFIADQSNGDIACDSYHLWKQDVQMAADLGVHFYRFSMSWPRLLPNGFPERVSEDAKTYYGNLIDELLSKGIEPVVTLYHWDLPQRLQDIGGWANPLISDWFADYARIVYSLYADRVKTWITINEPLAFCDAVYNLGILAPPLHYPDHVNYLCNKHALLAHAKAYRIYDEEFKSIYHGQVSLSNQLFWFEAASEDDEELAELVREYGTGRFSHPIYSKEGGWPPAIQKVIAAASKEEGHPRSKLPAFTKEEIELVRGTYDFYGLNHYTLRLVRKAKDNEPIGIWPLQGARDLGAVFETHPDWKHLFSWFMLKPESIRHQLAWLKKRYGDIKILITENGYGSLDRNLADEDRVQFYKDSLEQVLLSIKEDGVNVIGYTAWTLMDNFEWLDGYKASFGLYKVDFNDPKRTRTARDSARYYASVIKNHSLKIAEKDESKEKDEL